MPHNQAINYAFGAMHLRPDPLLQASLAARPGYSERYGAAVNGS